MKLKSFYKIVLVSVFFSFIFLTNGSDAQSLKLNREQSQQFIKWFLLILEKQHTQMPNPRWVHRDCAGLIRFAVKEAFAEHHKKWKFVNGFLGQALPAEIELSQSDAQKMPKWHTLDSEEKTDFVLAYTLIQKNTFYVGKDLSLAKQGDLFFFDQGEDQHIMVWTGQALFYHTGSLADKNKPIKSVTLKELLSWKDSRWRPVAENPNFIGVYRLAFLSL